MYPIKFLFYSDLFIFQFLQFALPQFLANALSYQVSHVPLMCSIPDQSVDDPQLKPDSQDEEATPMTSLGVSVQSLHLAWASMTQAANSDSRFHPKWRAISLVTLLVLALVLYLRWAAGGRDSATRGEYYHNRAQAETNGQNAQILSRLQRMDITYNDTYPLSRPEKTQHGIRYRIGMIADLDLASRSSKDQTWFSYLKRGYLTVSESADRLEVEWDADTVVLESHLSENGRGTRIPTNALTSVI